MLHVPIVATRELNDAEQVARGPIAGIMVALPMSLAFWVIIIGVARAWL